MQDFKPEITELLLMVEKKYKKSLSTTTDFKVFSLQLESELGHLLSPSTLKRLWGYVNDHHQPSPQTLNLLCQYLGFDHFKAFCTHLKNSNLYNSSFFTAKQVQIQELTAGDHVEIGWSPNRYLLLHYQGNTWFEVLESHHSKLQQGDRFEAVNFLLGQPLTLAYVLREDQKTSPFIAGRNGGLTLVNRINHE